MTMADRSPADRRSGKDRRSRIRIFGFLRKGDALDSERRSSGERRSPVERRDGWVRIGKWVGVCLDKLKIAKFLR